MKVLIVAGGKPPSLELLKRSIARGYDYIIAADSGARVLLDHGISFHLIVGDFDSLDENSRKRIARDQEVISLETEKDYTDTEAAFHEAVKRGASDILILGATGDRQDHFMGNLAILRQALDQDVKAVLADDHNQILMTDRSMDIEYQKGWIPSFFPYGGDVRDFSLLNVKYPLIDHHLKGDSTLTVSNEFLKGPARIEFRIGTVLVMLARDKD